MPRLSPLIAVAALAPVMLGGCTTPQLHSQVQGSRLAANGAFPVGASAETVARPAARPQLETLAALIPAATSTSPWAEAPPLSPGDRLQVEIEDGEGFSGRYEIDIDGTLRLPHLAPIAVAGHATDEAEAMVAQALVDAELFRPHRVRVSVRVHEWAHVQVFVSGAVFAPGMVSVNVRSAEERALKTNLASGDFPSERLLPAALRAAGGVRPDASVDNILLTRDGVTTRVDYSRLLTGGSVPPVPLMSGDRITIPNSGQLDDRLVLPSAITPPGIRVFLSNLTVPAQGNSPSAIGKDATSLPYGTRLLTAAVSANCVGGTHMTSAGRHVVLVRSEPLLGHEEALDQPINALLKSPQDSRINPHLMPNDSVACYDSGVTNLRDIAATIAALLLPFGML